MTTETILRLPGAPALEDLRFRRVRAGPGRAADFEALAELMAQANLVDRIPYIPTAATLAAEIEHDPTSNLETDAIVAEVDDRMIAWAQAGRAMRGEYWVHDLWGCVHPSWRRRGLGRALLRANIARARDVGDGDRPGTPMLSANAEETEAGAQALFESEGFRPVRWFTLMRRPLGEPVPEVLLPEGLEVRPVEPDQHQTIEAAENEAFRDHWGHRESTDEDLKATLAQPDLDVALWQVAWDGDQVAGVVQNWIWPSENERLGVRRGWLERVSVRRPWRRRGLARALIARSLVLLAEAGMEDAMLGVDADNPQGALGLYESLGFRLDQRSTAYWRPFDP